MVNFCWRSEVQKFQNEGKRNPIEEWKLLKYDSLNNGVFIAPYEN